MLLVALGLLSVEWVSIPGLHLYTTQYKNLGWFILAQRYMEKSFIGAHGPSTRDSGDEV